MYLLRDHFDVAHLLGHPAFDYLGRACSMYRLVHDHNLNDPSVHDWTECLAHGARLAALRRTEVEACVHAVVLFQAMMEKVPHFVPAIGGGLNSTNAKQFAASWNALLDQISDVADKVNAKAAFRAYYTDFYSAMRNPIIHGRQAADIAQVNSISTLRVHAGMEAGWRAYDYLLTETFNANGQTHEPSWSTMCAAHGVPDILDVALFPDLEALSREYIKRHLDGSRASSSAD